MNKRNILALALMGIIMVITICGCSKRAGVANEIDDGQYNKVAGIVNGVEDKTVSIRLCGNIFGGQDGAGILFAELGEMNVSVGDSVCISYEGELKFTHEFAEAANAGNTNNTDNGAIFVKDGCIDIKSVTAYENDYEFEAELVGIDNLVDENGDEYNVSDSNFGSIYFYRPTESEPELDFTITLRGNKLKEVGQVSEFGGKVTISYNPDTMSIVSINDIHIS